MYTLYIHTLVTLRAPPHGCADRRESRAPLERVSGLGSMYDRSPLQLLCHHLVIRLAGAPTEHYVSSLSSKVNAFIIPFRARPRFAMPKAVMRPARQPGTLPARVTQNKAYSPRMRRSTRSLTYIS